MKKLLKNRIFLGSVAIVLALLVCFVAAPALNAAVGKETTIVRVTSTVAKGTKLTSDMVQTVKVGGYNLPDNVLKDQDSVVGKYALAAMQPGDYILSTKVSSTAPDIGLGSLDGKKQAFSVTIKTFAAGLSGKLESGDIIRFTVGDYGDMKDTLKPPELKYVKLIATTTPTGSDYTQNNNTSSDTSTSKKTQQDMPSTLTVLVNDEQAGKLTDYENNGRLHAALVYRGNTSNANKFLNMEDQYLSSASKSAGSDSTNGGSSNGK